MGSPDCEVWVRPRSQAVVFGDTRQKTVVWARWQPTRLRPSALSSCSRGSALWRKRYSEINREASFLRLAACFANKIANATAIKRRGHSFVKHTLSLSLSLFLSSPLATMRDLQASLFILLFDRFPLCCLTLSTRRLRPWPLCLR